MKLGRLNHIGVATPSMEKSIAYYRDVMGATQICEPFDMPEQGVKVCFVDTPGADGAQLRLKDGVGLGHFLLGSRDDLLIHRDTTFLEIVHPSVYAHCTQFLHKTQAYASVASSSEAACGW